MSYHRVIKYNNAEDLYKLKWQLIIIITFFLYQYLPIHTVQKFFHLIGEIKIIITN